MTIYDRFREFKNFTKHDGLMGIEIETETKKPYDPPSFFYWKADKDNSLRDFGMEYILKAPLPFDQVRTALKEFEDKTKDIKFIPDSNSTSVHIHMNMLNQTFMTLANLFTVYSMVENLLIRLSGPSRKSNLFCLPICDAEQTYKDMMSLLQSVERNRIADIWNNYSEDVNKYAAFNLAALGRLGSVEFRSFRGDPSIKAIGEWTMVLNSILTFCQTPGLTPPNVIERYRENKDKLMKDIFGVTLDAIKTACVASGDPFEKLVQKNFWYAASIAYCIKEWNVLDRTPETKKYKNTKALDAFCVASYGQVYKDLDPIIQQAARIIFKQNGGILHEVAQPLRGVADVWNQFVAVGAGQDAIVEPRGMPQRAEWNHAPAVGDQPFAFNEEEFDGEQ